MEKTPMQTFLDSKKIAIGKNNKDIYYKNISNNQKLSGIKNYTQKLSVRLNLAYCC